MDPYYAVQSDTTNLIKQLRITHDPKQQQQLISEIEIELDDLTEMVTLISKNRNRFHISDRELNVRKQFINRIKTELHSMNKSQLINTDFDTKTTEIPNNDEPISLQTYIKSNIAEQDIYLTEIGNSLETLKQINYQIADELTSQDGTIDDLTRLTEDTEYRLREGSKKIDQVTKSSDTKPQIIGIVALGVTVLGLFTALLHL
jgi:hypothetical protein